MQIEIWSDVICPWCYIGKRRFEKALAQFAGREQVQVTWRSFELDREAPRQHPGTLQDLLARKYGVSHEQALAMNARVSGLAEAEGLAYRLDQARPGNTFDAHRLIHFAVSRGQGDRAMERIMRAYFCEALPVGEHAALARLAPEFGMTEDAALAVLQGDAWGDAVRADEARAAAFGITGVPFFVFDEKSGISGAQAVEVLTRALEEAAHA